MLSLRYIHRDPHMTAGGPQEVEYKKFVQEVQAKLRDVDILRKSGQIANEGYLKPGAANVNSDITTRLIGLLAKMNEYVISQ